MLSSRLSSRTQSDDPLLPIEIVSRFREVAPVDVFSLARDLGIPVKLDPAISDCAGMILSDAGGSPSGYRIVINANDSPRRQRFTLAHEIAHYIFHRDLIGDGIKDDAMFRSKLRDEFERQADSAAANILLPADLVRKVYRAGVVSLVELTQRFNVSEQSLRIRLKELGLAP